MEIAKDRTTNATVETCSSAMFDSNECPHDTAPGQQFIRRSLNDPCHKMVIASLSSFIAIIMSYVCFEGL